MELAQLESAELFTDTTVTSQTVYLNVLFPSNYRYYLELVSNTETPILIDHPFRLYFPQTIMVSWAPPYGTNGIYLILESSPEFRPFEYLNIQIYIPQVMYDAIITAFLNPINSRGDLVPPPDENACGEVEFVLLSTDIGEQIKIDLINTSYVPEVPVTVETLQWSEVLYDVISLPLPPPLPPSISIVPPLIAAHWGSLVYGAVPWNRIILGSGTTALLHSSTFSSSTIEFAYTENGDLGITLIDPRYCFLREWITFPAEWTNAIKNFAGIQ